MTKHILILASLLVLSKPSVAGDRPYLEKALQAAKWIRSTSISTPHGTVWAGDPNDSTTIGTTLYSGSTGIVLFLLEAYHTTGDTTYLADARSGANYLLWELSDSTELSNLDNGLYTGIGGIGFTLGEMFKATKEPKYRNGLRQSAELLRTRATPSGKGVEWNYRISPDSTYFFTDIVSGSSGIGLFLLYAARELNEPAYEKVAVSAGKRLIEAGQRSQPGMKWAMDPLEPKFTTMFGRLMPNFAHGTAGICYFLASLYSETKEKEFLDAALEGTRYLQSVANTDSNAARIFHDEPDNPGLYYLGWCHGPAGTARLFYRLYQITGEKEWMDWVTKFARADFVSGIPEHPTPGFWNNVSICCGTASVADFFLSLHRITHEQSYLDFSKRLTTNLLSRDTSDAKGTRWIQAEHRIKPDLLIAQTGYMQGAAGIGMWLLRLDAFEQGKRESIILPDSPF